MGKMTISKYLYLYAITYVIMALPISLLINNTLPLFLGWNIILAVIPLLLSSKIIKYDILKLSLIKKLIVWLLLLLWLLFYPNSIYFITDLIHIGGTSFYSHINPYNPINYHQNILDWIILGDIALGLILSIIIGNYSFYLIFKNVNSLIKRKISILLMGVVFLLSSIGVYIGRFLRFNSWSVIYPLQLITGFIGSLNLFSLQYISLFFIIHLVAYLILYPFFNNLKGAS